MDGEAPELPPAGKSWLASEFLGAYAPNFNNVDLASGLISGLFDHDVPMASIEAAADQGGWDGPPLGVAEIEPRPDHLWHPVEGGERMLVLPVMDQGDVIDLAAFDPRQPGRRPLLRAGDAWCLGADNLDAARWEHDTFGTAGFPLDRPPPVLVLDDPVLWLRAGGRGVCVVGSWRRAVPHLLDLPLYVLDERVAECVMDGFARSGPQIFIDRAAA